jgi:hypothetical protein
MVCEYMCMRVCGIDQYCIADYVSHDHDYMCVCMCVCMYMVHAYAYVCIRSVCMCIRTVHHTRRGYALYPMGVGGIHEYALGGLGTACMG